MPDIDLELLAENLAKTATALDRHIKAEGKKIGDKLGVTYAKAADERIRDKDNELQRLSDLVAELRRQMKPLERYAAGYFTLKNQAEELVKTAKSYGEPVPAELLQRAVTAARDAEHDIAAKQKRRAADA